MKKQRLIPMIIVFIMIMNCLLPIVPVKAIDNDAIYLNQPLYEAVKAELIAKKIVASYSDAQGKITITEENRALVTSLDLKNKEISDLSGLECFVNLEELNLSGNRLTSESNLSILNDFQLSKLDLSSNYIEDISMIENYEEIESLSIQNQTIEKVTILDREAINNLEEGKIKLPQILDLIEDFNEFIFDDVTRFEKQYYSLSGNTEYKQYGTPVINNYAPHTLSLDLLDEEGNIKSGSIGFTFKINYGELINTTINLYFVVIDEEQRAAVFNDDNFYNAAKAQLTDEQHDCDVICCWGNCANCQTCESKKVINENLITYPNGIEEENLYHKAYDIAKVLVFDLNTLINKIPSLEVSGKEIKDISGLEAFVGLENELDLSNNYIDSIERLLELQANKDKETELLKERFKKQVGYIAETRGELVALLGQLEALETQIEAKKKEAEENPDKADEIQKALDGYINDKGEAVKGLYELRDEVVRKTNDKLATLKDRLNHLYVIYSNYYRTTTLSTIVEIGQELVDLSDMEKVKFATKEEGIAVLNAIFTKIANLEATKSLSDFETDMLISEFSMPTVDENGNEIKNPIQAYFISVLENSEFLTKGDCKNYISRIIEVSTLAQLNYNFPSIYVNGEAIDISDWENIKEDIKDEAVEELLIYASEYVESIINSVEEFDYNNMNLASDWSDKLKEKEDLETENKYIGYTKDEQRLFIKEYLDANCAEAGISDAIAEEIERLYKKELLENLAVREQLENLTAEEIAEKYYDDALENITNNIFSKKDGNSYTYVENGEHAIITGVVVYGGSSTKTFTITTVRRSIEVVKTKDEVVETKISQVLGISGKLVSLNENEINAWVQVPELKNINLSHNCLTNIDGIESINTLKVLNVSRNEISDISKVDWKEFAELEELYLEDNAISDISMLDVIKKLEVLNVSKNNLSGKFNLDVDKLERLRSADFSRNAYNDLRNLFLNHSMESGREDIYKYVYREVILAKGMIFDAQEIEVDLGKIVIGEDLYSSVPALITQLERMKPSDTYFDYSGSFEGKITATGKSQLSTDKLGYHTATLEARSENDSRCFTYLTYIVKYEVVKGMVKDVDVAIDENRNYAIIDGNTKFVSSITADANVTDISVNWSVEGNTSTDTEISDDGVLYVSSDEMAKELTVVATSNYDDSKLSRITLSVKKAEVNVSITSTANKGGIRTETSKLYNAVVNTEANDKTVTWSIKGNTSAATTISEDGILYIAKDEAAGGKITVIATSNYDSEAFAELIEVVINDEYVGDTTEPEDPSDTVDPVEPEDPSDTVDPVEPEDPSDTVDPVEPEDPSDTVDPVEPEDPSDTVDPVEPEDPSDTVDPVEPEKDKIEIKYETKDETIYVEKPNITIEEFVKGLVDGEYDITVSDGKGNKITDNTKLVATGMVVAIGDAIENTYEIVIVGDVNGDGKVDSIDSNFIKGHRVETNKLEAAEFEAADINKDGKVNKIDSFLLLFFRASKINDFSEATIESVMK